MVGRAALEFLAADLAHEGETETVAVFHDGVVALVGIAAVLREHALHFGFDFLVGDVDDRLVELDALDIHQGDSGQDFIFDFESEIGLAIENVIDDALVLRQVDLGLGGGALFALVQRIRDGGVDRVGHDLGHGRAAIDLLEMRGRHLARAEALDIGLALELFELGVEARIEVRGRNGDAELALEAVVEGFGYLHWGLIPY